MGSFEAWKGNVVKNDTNCFTINNKCYNGVLYSCQCLTFDYIARHSDQVSVNVTKISFIGESLSPCTTPLQCETETTTTALKGYFESYCGSIPQVGWVGIGCSEGYVCCYNFICLPKCEDGYDWSNSSAHVIGPDKLLEYYTLGSGMVLNYESEIANLNCTNLQNFQTSLGECRDITVMSYECAQPAFASWYRCNETSNGARNTLLCLAKEINANDQCKGCIKKLLKEFCCFFIGGKCCPKSETNATEDLCCSIAEISNDTAITILPESTKAPELATTNQALPPPPYYFDSFCEVNGCLFGYKCCGGYGVICMPECDTKKPTNSSLDLLFDDSHDYLYRMEIDVYGRLFETDFLEVQCGNLTDLQASLAKCTLFQMRACLMPASYDWHKCKETSNNATDIVSCTTKKIDAIDTCKVCTKKIIKALCCYFIGGKCCSNSNANIIGDPCCNI